VVTFVICMLVIYMCVISTRAQYDSRGEEISRLEATNQSMTEEQQELLRKLSETEHDIPFKQAQVPQ